MRRRLRHGKENDDDDDDGDDDEQDQIPLHHKRPFGAGLKRTRVEFVRAQQQEEEEEYEDAADSVSALGSDVGDLYASIVMMPGSRTGPQTSDAVVTNNNNNINNNNNNNNNINKQGINTKDYETCGVCSLPVTTSVRDHEALLAHQVSVAHSHPPSAVDRSRMGLRALAAQGWDPDGRRGLGREGGEGVRFPIKVAAKRDTLGIGAVVSSAVEKEEEEEEEERRRRRRKRPVGMRERRAREAEERRRAERLRDELYGRVDVERYLAGEGREWE